MTVHREYHRLMIALPLALASVVVLQVGAGVAMAQSEWVPLARLYNPNTGDHFYTSSRLEGQRAQRRLGYTFEGVAAYVASDPDPGDGLVPLYRLFNPSAGTHFYTTDRSEGLTARDQLGFHFEGVAGYISASPGDGLAPLYRLSNTSNGDHLYTTSRTEGLLARDQLGYQFEGIIGYVQPAPEPTR